MKTKPSFRTVLAILVVIACGAAFVCYADGEYVGEVSSSVNSSGVDVGTNGGFSARDSVKWVKNVSYGDSYAYADLERNILEGTNVYYSLHVSGSAFVGGQSPSGTATAISVVEIEEYLGVAYVADSVTDTAPTSVSFQPSYLLQGQVLLETDSYFESVIRDPNGGWTDPGVLGTSVVISTIVLGDTITIGLNGSFNFYQQLGGSFIWDASSGVPTQPAKYDLRLLFQGFVNIVDQNNQPIPPNKIKLYCVDSDAPKPVGVPVQPDPNLEENVSLEAIPGTNSLTIQWPSDTTNYQLETSTNFASGWGTNSLPLPVSVGPFLQVTVPTTNAAAFFRLLQTN